MIQAKTKNIKESDVMLELEENAKNLIDLNKKLKELGESL